MFGQCDNFLNEEKVIPTLNFGKMFASSVLVNHKWQRSRLQINTVKGIEQNQKDMYKHFKL